MSRRILALFAKAPAPGRVKTRLCPPLTPVQAAELYEAMLLDVLDQHAPRRESLVVWFTPTEERAWFERVVPSGYRLQAQTGPDLGSRMSAVFRLHFREGFDHVVLRGTDSPTLPESRIDEAFAALADADVVLCPDLDGGYNLVGVRRVAADRCAALFDVTMSTTGVLDATCAHARDQGLSTRLLVAHHDVDVAADLQRLRDDVDERTPRTRRWLANGPI